jgi:hypothetical protein
LFHVQTEDSGVSNPHIFTHLFHDGVILASKKMVYDANSDVDVVKGLMQAQHKSVLRELKSGTYDGKIRQYLGAPPGTGDVDYDEVSVETDDIKTPTPVPVKKPTTVGAVADLGDPGKIPAGANIGHPSATDVSAAFRAISHASAQMNVGRRTGTTAPPPASPEEAADLVFGAPNAAPPPPGSGVWSGKPEHAQERPFDRTGNFPAMKTDTKGRTVPPATAEGSDPRGKVMPGVRPGTTVPPPAKPPTTPPGARPIPRSTGAPPPVPGAAPRPAGTIPATNRPSGSPPPVNAPAARPPMVQGNPVRPPGTATPVAGSRTAAGPTGAPQPNRPAAPARPAGSTAAPAGAAPGTQPPAGPPRQGQQSSANVIVARPAVIVGAPPQVVGGPGAGARRSGTGPREAIAVPPSDSIFGKDLISEKSLDEVIMAYLSEDANEE